MGKKPENRGVLPAEQGKTDKVGPGHPPKAHQWKPGQSGNPRGAVRRRLNLWVWYVKYMEMTPPERARLAKRPAELTGVQQMALRLVEKAVEGEQCGAEGMAKYAIDRDEGRAREYIHMDEGDTLSDEEREELRALIQEMQRDRSD